MTTATALRNAIPHRAARGWHQPSPAPQIAAKDTELRSRNKKLRETPPHRASGPHPVRPDHPSWAERRIKGEADVRDVIELLRLNYDRVVARFGLPATAA